MISGYTVGLLLAVAVAALGRSAGFDRDRAFYSTILIVVGSYYVLFAVMGGSMHALAVELIGLSVFVACAVVGFRKSVWLLVAGLAGHGVFDFFHGYLVSNPGRLALRGFRYDRYDRRPVGSAMPGADMFHSDPPTNARRDTGGVVPPARPTSSTLMSVTVNRAPRTAAVPEVVRPPCPSL
jgi:hypothetical protein